jgi:membrane protease YdiL (CAAX protease family)
MVWLPTDAFRQALGIPLYWAPVRQGFVRPTTVWEFVVAGIVGLLLVPLAEKTILRGYVLQVLVQRVGFWPGLLAHSVLFALYHAGIGPGLPIYIFVRSFFPALLFLHHRSRYPPILMHALNNVWVDLLLPVLS